MKVVQREHAAARRRVFFRALVSLALVWLGLALGACDREESALIHISTLERADEDELLVVHGDGFPSGRRGTATLRGLLHGPFGEVNPVALTLPCRAESARRLVVALHAREHEEAGLFEGALEIAFAGQDASATVVAKRAHAVVRFAEHDLKTRLEADRAARGFLHDVGITRVESVARGLLIADVRSEGLAAVAGLRPRDVITRAEGAPIETASDLAFAPHARALSLDVQRAGKPVSITLPLSAKTRAAAASLLTWLAFAVSFLGLCVMPLPERVARPRLSLKPLALGALLTLITGLLPHFHGFDLRWALPPALLVYKLALGLDLLRTGKRSDEIVRALLPVAALTLALTTFNVLANTASWHIQDPRVLPAFEWPLLCAPPAWLAFAIMCQAFPVASPRSSLVSQVSAAWLACTSAAAVSAFGLGGGSLSPLLPQTFAPFLVWIVKAVFAFWLMREAFPIILTRHANLLSLFAPVLAAGFLALDPNPTLTCALSGASSGALCAMILKSLASAAARHKTLRGPDPLLEPFR